MASIERKAKAFIFANCGDTIKGDDLYLVGNIPELGAWIPHQGIKLSGTNWPIWEGEMKLTISSEPINCKLVIIRRSGLVDWDYGVNTTFTISSNLELELQFTWHKPEAFELFRYEALELARKGSSEETPFELDGHFLPPNTPWLPSSSPVSMPNVWGGQSDEGRDIKPYSARRDYTLHEKLGEGSYGTVYRATSNDGCEEVAIKVIKKSSHTWQRAETRLALETECDILEFLRTENAGSLIMEVIDIYDDCEARWIVSEFMSNGDLFDLCFNLQSQHTELSECEDVVKRLFKSMILSVARIHELGICHRDIKPENFMLNCKSSGPGTPDLMALNPEEVSVRLIDFGLAEYYKDNGPTCPLSGTHGTYDYMAPEILRAESDAFQKYYTNKCDIWSLGVTFYMLLNQRNPFFASIVEMPSAQELDIFHKQGALEYSYPTDLRFGLQKERPDGFSPHLEDLFSKMMCSDPERRLTAQECLQHEWFAEEKTRTLSTICSAIHFGEILQNGSSEHLPHPV